MSATTQKKGPTRTAIRSSHVQPNPEKDQEMNKATHTTTAAPGRAAALAQVIYSTSVEANDLADLLHFISKTARACAYNSTSEEYLRFHEIRLALDGAVRMMRDHAEELDGLSTDVGALGSTGVRS